MGSTNTAGWAESRLISNLQEQLAALEKRIKALEEQVKDKL